MSELSRCDTNPGAKRYLRSLRIAMMGYAVLLLLGIVFLRTFPETRWRFAVMLLPVLPAIHGLVSVMRFVRAMDELQRRVHLEGVAFAFASTIVICLTWGLLERAGLPKLPTVWVCTIMIGLWGIGNYIAAARYK